MDSTNGNGNGNGHSNGHGNGHNGHELPAKPYVRQPAELIRQRRKVVEEMLLMPAPPMDIYRALKDTYPVSYEQIRKDVRIIRRYWRIDDRKNSDRRREECLRRYARKILKTEAQGKWAANHNFEVLYARVAGILSGPLIEVNQTSITQVIQNHSRVTAVLDTLGKDERKRLADSLALAERGNAAAPVPLRGVPLRLGRGEPPGAESPGAENPPEGSD